MFRAGFVGATTQAGVPDLAEMLMVEVEGPSDPAGVLTSHGVPVGAVASPAGLGEGAGATPIAAETATELARAPAADGIDVAATDPAVLNEIIRRTVTAALQQQR
ncbi:hypothetical protein [Amycolatopsis sp. SID8362]|uniref:hypothetical protein n=1 Tax=Amycolatopsis sp. SID8362 TaxID=2690346 RepID=UPI0013688EBC|nr:hypothetical protein [Amycolatopsis sp. SID8362]NBH10362.1 hypothetical protein [Amycolatopsis sp. SID8362]NED47057.1 hypothetical protein [Amycolatopsis sp. SID8362]